MNSLFLDLCLPHNIRFSEIFLTAITNKRLQSTKAVNYKMSRRKCARNQCITHWFRPVIDRKSCLNADSCLMYNIFLHPLPKLLQFASRYNVAKFKMAVRFSVSKTFVTATNNGVWNVKFNSLWTVITFYWSRRV